MQITTEVDAIRVRFIDQDTEATREVKVTWNAADRLRVEGAAENGPFLLSVSAAKALAAAVLLLEV